MAATKRDVAVGVFDTRTKAERAVDQLRQAGFREDQIGVVSPNEDPTAGIPEPAGTEDAPAMGAAAGVIAGGSIGTLAGLAAAAGIIPPLGPVVAGGILTGILASAAIGLAAGGLIGALVGMGIPEREAHLYERHLREGRTLITVRADGRYTEAVNILSRCGGYDPVNPYFEVAKPEVGPRRG
jgi:hypothetical protein